ncbi:MAG TPA: HXXEE domain-containing protein [Spirochaetota bacterium]|nr:HXXEE domain-containing protein [Spirochaetota bacterium]HPV42684.1 HXXEE domain-containing protein [Spirochaetota bacterium]
MKTEMIMWLFPVVFMVHEFEEIIFVRRWIDRNREELARRFPRLSERMLPRLEGISTASFAFVVAEEFILVALVTFGAYWFSLYALFIGMIIGYGMHLAVHIVQFFIFRRYIPAIVTSALTGVYVLYAIYYFYVNGLMPLPDVVIFTVAAVLTLAANLALMHKLAEMLDL